MEEVATITNIPNEIVFVGCLYKNSELFVKYGRSIASEYDFSDNVAKFLYDNGENMFEKYSQDFNENSINLFMMQDIERKRIYREIGGWKTIHKAMSICNIDDADNYYQMLKKYSLLRELKNKGFDVSKIMKHKNFPTWDANKISALIRRKMDKISTIILSDKESSDLTIDAVSKVIGFINAPKIGLPIPFNIINSSIKGIMQQRNIGFGLLSNAGKSRLCMYLACHLAFVCEQKVLFMSNEMDESRMFSAMMTTVFNSKEIQEKHGWNITKTEDELKLGRYRDANGEFIERIYDKDGNPKLTDEEYQNYLLLNSPELKEIIKITTAIEEKMNNQIFFKNVGSDYSDETLKFEINKHHKIYGIKLFFYDTLKPYKEENWTVMKHTLSQLSEMVNSLKSTLIYNFQLTDDSVHINPLELTSLNIASAKGIKHLADSMFLCKEIYSNELYLYEYGSVDEDWGAIDWQNLNPKYRWLAVVVDKNRDGNKTNVVFKFDLDLNTWDEMGQIRKKYFETNKKKKK